MSLSTVDPLSMNSDTVVKNFHNLVVSSPAGITAQGLTVADNTLPGIDIQVEGGSHLDIDSSYVGAQGISSMGGSTCTITNSRGPVMNPGGTGCQNFQTTASPNFLSTDPATPQGYHLALASPLIDAGGTVANQPLDIDGAPRLLDNKANGVCAPRLDIGADETAANNADCPPVGGGPGPGPGPGPGTVPPKKCKKKKKKKRAAAAKKKKKKCKKKRKK
jgi:hypothetical protein